MKSIQQTQAHYFYVPKNSIYSVNSPRNSLKTHYFPILCWDDPSSRYEFLYPKLSQKSRGNCKQQTQAHNFYVLKNSLYTYSVKLPINTLKTHSFPILCSDDPHLGMNSATQICPKSRGGKVSGVVLTINPST